MLVLPDMPNGLLVYKKVRAFEPCLGRYFTLVKAGACPCGAPQILDNLLIFVLKKQAGVHWVENNPTNIRIFIA